MSFRNNPVTKNCSVLDVMGNRIVIPDSQNITTKNEVNITNWQPFQIYGGRVKPCDLTMDGVNYYMPKIGNIPIDDPKSKLTGFGDVFLSVKFSLSLDGVFSIDTEETPTIGFVNRGNTIMFNISPTTGDYTIQQPWFSWRIGKVQNGYENSLRYFCVRNQLSQAEIDAGPIYQKNVTDPGFPGEVFWGFTYVSVIPPRAYSRPTPDPDPLTQELQFGSFQMLGSNTSDPVSGSEIWAYGDDTFSGPTIFHAFSVSTPV